MKLYGMLASPYVGAVVLATRHMGITLPLETPPGGGIKSPEYLAINPVGKMPVLEHDGRHLAESVVIIEYLQSLGLGRSILPADKFEAAKSRLVTRVFELYVVTAGGALFRNLNPATRDAAAVDAAKASLATAFGHVEHFMNGDGYCAGGTMSLADCVLLPQLTMMRLAVLPAFGMDDPTAGRPKLAAWSAKVASDPVNAQFVTDYTAAVQGFLARMRGG